MQAAWKEMNKVIRIATEFSRTPGGRYIKHGPHSGEHFRKTLLNPALLECDQVEVDLDGTAGYAASFLEEAFGGTVTDLGYDFVKPKLVITSKDNPLWVQASYNYMEKARYSPETDSTT